jgi:hypothetical protein
MGMGESVLQKAKKPSKSYFGRVVGIAAVAAVAYGAYTAGLLDRAKAFLPVDSDPSDATLAANLLRSDMPECATYRYDILRYKGKPKTEATQAAIKRLVEQGFAAGCKKSDLT